MTRYRHHLLCFFALSQHRNMFIYNVTSKVSHDIETEWLIWMRETHIPELLSTRLFSDFKILRLLDTDESDGITYAIQYFCQTRASYDTYIAEFAAEKREKAYKKWGDRVFAFRTLMEVIN